MPMRFPVSLTTALIITAFALAACGKGAGGNSRTGERAAASPSPQAAQTPPPDGVRRVTISELQAALEKNEAVVVDVRGGVEYRLGHIKGALSIPLGLVAEQAGLLPRDKLIVTYCA